MIFQGRGVSGGGASASAKEPIEHVIPAADEAISPYDANRKVKFNQGLKWLLVVGVPVVGIGAFTLGSIFTASPPVKSEMPAHINATQQAANANLAPSQLDEAALASRDEKQKLEEAEKSSLGLQQQLSEKDARISALETQANQAAAARTRATGSVSAVGSDSVATPVSGGSGQNGPPLASLANKRVRTGAAGGPQSAMLQRLGQLPSGSSSAQSDAPPAPPASLHRALSVIVAGGGGDQPAPGTGMQKSGGIPLPSASAGYGLTKPAGAPGAPGASSKSVSANLEVYDENRFVPPNAYVDAKVLVGVDATTGTSFSQDPKPVLFRIIGKAVHVGPDGKHQTTDLDGCEVNGAAYAELPSEKVYIKLQKITCPAGPGKFSVATVEGYIASRGKAGVRGRVISREGQFTSRALIAGMLNGLGQGLSTNVQRSQSGVNTSVTGSGLLSARELTPEQIASGSIGTGISNAASMLADYYIKRAEQYQPVIEMPTGIVIQLVFLTGFQVR